MNWEELLKKSSESFYTIFLMELTSMLVIIMFFLKKRKTKYLIHLALISIASLGSTLLANYNSLTSGKVINRTIGGLSMLVYIFIEIICCTLFIKSHVQSALGKKLLQASPIIFAGYMLTTFLIGHSSPPSKSGSVFNVFSFEGFLIIIQCLYFFYELISHEPGKKQYNPAALWAISGMLIFFSAVAPFSIFIKYLFKNDEPLLHHLMAINYAAYSLLFITFCIAILRDKQTMQQVV